jgi:methionine sulfoxide reductase heme-binding subunit
VHLTSSPIDWYAARAAGVAAYVLLTAVVVLGLTLASGQPGRRWPRWPRFAVEDVHRVGGLLVGTFVAVHVATIAVDSFLPFSPRQLVVPLASTYRPIWTGLGIAAAELLAALAITNHYRRRLPYRWWRGAHYANFAVWVAATLHGLGSGTDRNAGWMVAIYAAASATVAALTMWRIATRRRAPTASPGLVAAIGSAAALTAVALAFGPLATHARAWNATTFSDRLTGRILEQTGTTRAIVSMTGVGHGTQNVLVRADLLVAPGALEATTFQMEFLPSGLICTGKVSEVQQLGFRGTCSAGGHRRIVDARWQLTSDNRLVGTLQAHSAEE